MTKINFIFSFNLLSNEDDFSSYESESAFIVELL